MEEPKIITLQTPERFSSGIWGIEEGDIPQSYFADISPSLRTPFSYRGRQYVSSGGHHGIGLRNPANAWCYELCDPSHMQAKESPDGKRTTYPGAEVSYSGKKFILGEQVRFTHRQLKVSEVREMLRRLYAYGGLFAAGKSYREMLLEFAEDTKVSSLPISNPHYLPGIDKELASSWADRERSDIKTRLETTASVFLTEQGSQYSLF
jgi:hypothetical protein